MPTAPRKYREPNRVKQEQLIAEYFANGGRKRQAGQKVGVPWSTVKDWFANDEEFKRAVSEFKEMWLDNLRAVAFKRATERSDTLLIFLMKSLEPETYDDDMRKTKWMAERQLTNPETQSPVRVVLVRDEEPARIREEREKTEANEQ